MGGMPRWFFSPWWPFHFSSFALGCSVLCMGSRGGIPDIMVVYFIAGILGVLLLGFVRSLFRFRSGWGYVAGYELSGNVLCAF